MQDARLDAMDIIATKRQIPVMRKKKEGVGGAREVGTYSEGGEEEGEGEGRDGRTEQEEKAGKEGEKGEKEEQKD